MDNKLYNHAINRAVQQYGEDNQISVAVEEMAELTKELMKWKRPDVDKQRTMCNIAEEIADVEIMLSQLKIIFSCAGAVEDEKSIKINRLLEKLLKQ